MCLVVEWCCTIPMFIKQEMVGLRQKDNAMVCFYASSGITLTVFDCLIAIYTIWDILVSMYCCYFNGFILFSLHWVTNLNEQFKWKANGQIAFLYCLKDYNVIYCITTNYLKPLSQIYEGRVKLRTLIFWVNWISVLLFSWEWISNKFLIAMIYPRAIASTTVPHQHCRSWYPIISFIRILMLSLFPWFQTFK